MTIIKLKRGLKATWEAENPVLVSGEPGVELDTHMTKVGDGVTPWNELPYDVGDSGVKTMDTVVTLTPSQAVHQYNINALANALEIVNPAWSNVLDGRNLLLRIKDNGTIQTIAWGDKYRAIGITLPNATVAGKTLYVGAKWNAVDTKFDVLAVGLQA